jgi:hypothetical protein
MDYSVWAHGRRKLIDDLWALAVSRIHELPTHEARVNQHAELVGRALEPWKGLLAVASWLDANGVAGLWDRMSALSVNYQTERPNLTIGDLTSLVIQALAACVESNLAANPSERAFTFPTKIITESAHKLIEDCELDFDSDRVNSRRIGRVLKKMRFSKSDERLSRGWAVNLPDLARWANSYGIKLPDSVSTRLEVGTPRTNVANVANAETSQISDVYDNRDVCDVSVEREVVEL